MAAVALRGLRARKLRTGLTTLTVLLGVALIAGTYVLTDTIDRSFDRIFATASKGVDVAVTPHQSVSDTQPSTIPPATLARVRRVPGVAAADVNVFDSARILTAAGKNVGPHGAPDFVYSVERKPFNPFTYVQGAPPRMAGHVAIDQATADKAGLKLGGSLIVVGDGPKKRYTISGIARFGDVGSIAGSSVAIMTLPEAQRVLGKGRGVDAIDVRAAPGVSARQLSSRLRAALPRSLDVRTGEQQAAKNAKDVRAGVSFIRTTLLVFGFIALFVGAFMIFNTFSITVAQRTREFALLRTLGASRRQVLATVTGEAVLIGLVASALGLAAGLVLAPALKALLKAFGLDIPAGGTVVEARTILVALAAGLLVTLAASLSPAVRATRVAPVAALTDAGLLAPTRRSRWRTPVAALLGLLGAALIVGGLVGSGNLKLLGAGAAIVFLSAALLAHFAVRPLAWAVGAPLERMAGVTGRLARENATRNPRRTASTAAALMIGVALVAFVTVFAAGLKASINRAVDRGFNGAVVLQSSSFEDMPAALPAAVARVPGVGTVAGVRFTAAKFEGKKIDVSGAEAAPLARVYRLTEGRVLPPASAAKQWAKDHHVHVGSTVALLTPTGKRVRYRVASIYKDESQLLGNLTVPNRTLARDFGIRRDGVIFIGAAPGVPPSELKHRVDALLHRAFPVVDSYTKAGFKRQQSSQINQILALFYVLLSLSVVVSLFGIVTTLALAITERQRELGMLRAIGTSRRQLRRIVRYESVITALIGALIGVVLGIVFAVVITRPLGDQGFVLSIPVGALLALLALAAVAGVLAALGPARRASRVDVLRALAYE